MDRVQGTVNAKESGWRKIEKAAITQYKHSEELNESALRVFILRCNVNFSFISLLSVYCIYSFAAQSGVY